MNEALDYQTLKSIDRDHLTKKRYSSFCSRVEAGLLKKLGPFRLTSALPNSRVNSLKYRVGLGSKENQMNRLELSFFTKTFA